MGRHRQKTNPPKTQRIPSRLLARRYNISTKTIDRWLEIGILPQPIIVINRCRYWDEVELDAFDAALVAEQKAKRQALTPEVRQPQAKAKEDHAT